MSGAPPKFARQVSSDHWLSNLPSRIGQIIIDRLPAGGFALCHRDDVGRADLAEHRDAEDAIRLAQYDDAGAYRPLKTAPNVRHGWKLILSDTASARMAVDLFYPGRLSAWTAWRRGSLQTTAFRETLGRQTGMYRVAAKISDEQADNLIGSFCRSDGGCLRTILWSRDVAGTVPSTQLPPEKFDPGHDQTGRGKATLPLLCQEACNLLVAEARKVVKGEAA